MGFFHTRDTGAYQIRVRKQTHMGEILVNLVVMAEEQLEEPHQLSGSVDLATSIARHRILVLCV